VSTAADTVPASDIDPFCREFFEDPFPAHQALREAGPVVRLTRYGAWGAARYPRCISGSLRSSQYRNSAITGHDCLSERLFSKTIFDEIITARMRNAPIEQRWF
jgi:hypothetical protein